MNSRISHAIPEPAPFCFKEAISFSLSLLSLFLSLSLSLSLSLLRFHFSSIRLLDGSLRRAAPADPKRCRLGLLPHQFFLFFFCLSFLGLFRLILFSLHKSWKKKTKNEPTKECLGCFVLLVRSRLFFSEFLFFFHLVFFIETVAKNAGKKIRIKKYFFLLRRFR